MLTFGRVRRLSMTFFGICFGRGIISKQLRLGNPREVWDLFVGRYGVCLAWQNRAGRGGGGYQLNR